MHDDRNKQCSNLQKITRMPAIETPNTVLVYDTTSVNAFDIVETNHEGIVNQKTVLLGLQLSESVLVDSETWYDQQLALKIM